MGSKLGNIYSKQSCDVNMNSNTKLQVDRQILKKKIAIMILHEIANYNLSRIKSWKVVSLDSQC